MRDINSRLKLFAVIQPGDSFWSGEISRHGADEVLARIVSEKFYLKHPASSRLSTEIKLLDGAQLENELHVAGGVFISPENTDWPIQLDDLLSPPIGLIIKGDRQLLPKIENSIAIVGSRNPTSYGIRVAEDLAAAVCDREFAMVSGGAYGIDTAAHRGALASDGITVAVLGGGVSTLYPSGNNKIFQEIIQTGLLISEVMPGVPAQPFRFLIRNRLIAALSRATVVAEAAFRSGSIRTARDAAEILRPVFAIPGPITSPLSDGCHRLIAERVAEIATSVDEILEMVLPLHLK